MSELIPGRRYDLVFINETINRKMHFDTQLTTVFTGESYFIMDGPSPVLRVIGCNNCIDSSERNFDTVYIRSRWIGAALGENSTVYVMIVQDGIPNTLGIANVVIAAEQ